MALIVKGRDFMWPVVLRENTITVEDKEDYMVSIKKYRSTKTFADVANEISIERTEYRPETVEHIEKLAEQKIVEMLLNGNMFTGEYFIYKPSISGVFDSKGEPREGVQLNINVSGTALLREALGEVKFEIVEKQEMGGAVILQVKDLQSGKTDGSLIRGHAVEASGRKVKCVQQDGVTLHKIRFVSASWRSLRKSLTSSTTSLPAWYSTYRRISQKANIGLKSRPILRMATKC